MYGWSAEVLGEEVMAKIESLLMLSLKYTHTHTRAYTHIHTHTHFK